MKNTKKLLALIVSFAIAFTCFVCVPFNAFAAGTVTANTVSEFRTALADSSVDHIIIKTTINDDTVTVDRALTLEGAAGIDWHINGVQLLIKGNSEVTIKNINIKRGSDTVRVEQSPTITYSGGKIRCEHTGSGNEGAIYACNFDGTLNVTDDAVIESSNWAAYTYGPYSTGVVNFNDCSITKITGGEQKALLMSRGPIVMNIGDGVAGHEVTVSQNGGNIWVTKENDGAVLNIKPGAVINIPTGDWVFFPGENIVSTVNVSGGTFNCAGKVFVPNKKGTVNISGGTFNGSETVVYIDYSDTTATISGGTFNCSKPAVIVNDGGTNGVTITGGNFVGLSGCNYLLQKNNGKLTIEGGNFTNDYGSVLYVNNSNNGDVTVSGGSFASTQKIFDLNNTYIQYNFNDLDITSSTGDIFNLGEDVTVTLNNTNITATNGANAVTGQSSSYVLLTKGSTITGPTGNVTVTRPKYYKVNGTDYESIGDALNAVANNGTIQLNEDVYGNVEINTAKTVTIAGNSKEFFGAVTVSAGNVTLSGITAPAVKTGGSAVVTINGGEIGGGDATALELKSGFSGTVNVVNDAVITSNYLAIDVNSGATGATLNLKDCDVTTNYKGNNYSAIRQAGDNTINIGNGATEEVANIHVVGTQLWATNGNYAKLNIYNGAVLTNPNADWSMYINHGNSAVHVYGGQFNFGGPAFVMNDSGASLTIDGGTFTGTNTGNVCEELILKNNGAVTITGGTFTNDYGSILISDKANGTLAVSGGTFSAGGPVFILDSQATTNITDGEFASDGSVLSNGTGVIVVKDGTVNISDGTFTQTGADTTNVLEVSGSEASALNVSGGEFEHENEGSVIAALAGSSNAAVTVSGGTFATEGKMFAFVSTATYLFDGVTISAACEAIFDLGPNVLVTLDNGSEITYEGKDYVAIGDETGAATISILNGSTIDGDVDENVNVIDDRPRYFQIGDDQYETIEAALAAVENGETIELIAVVGNVTLNADKTYTFSTGDFEVTNQITITDGTVTLDNVTASGIKLSGDAVVTVDGGAFNAGSGNALELLSGFTGSVTATNGAILSSEGGYVYKVNSGAAGTVNFESCSLIDSDGDLSKIEGSTTTNLGKSDGSATVTVTGESDVFWFSGANGAVINSYAGVTINGGRPFNLNESCGTITVNVYGGTYSAGGSNNIMSIRCQNPVIYIDGGSYTVNDNDTNWFSISSNANTAQFTIKNLDKDRTSNAGFVYSDAKSGTFTFDNCRFTQHNTNNAICIEGINQGSANTVNITNCYFYSYGDSAAKFATSDGKTLAVNILGDNTTTFGSKLANAINKTEGVTINDANSKLVVNSANLDGTARILRMAGKKTGDWPGIQRTISGLAANTNYTFTFNYRATGGATLWKTVEYNGAGLTPVSDTGTTVTYTFTTTDTDSNRLWIRLGRDESPAIGANGTLYLADFSLKAAGSSDNLISNGNFANGVEGWSLINSFCFAVNSADVIPYIDNFFNDTALETASLNYALALKGGDRHEVQFKVYLEANTSYTFSYHYRAYGDTPSFGIQGDNIVVSDASLADNMFKKTYTITNDKAEGEKVRFWFRGGAGSTDNIVYLSGLSLYKEGTGANLVADLDPVFGTTDALRLNQDDGTAMTNIAGHGWLGNFKTDSDGGVVNNGSNRYTSVIAVPAEFYVRLSDADILAALVNYLIGARTDSINPYFDATRDTNINIIDLVRIKKQIAGAFGGDAVAETLKTTIMNAANTQTTGTVYRVAKGESISTANGKASSGDTILLERGGTWRVAAGNNSSITFKAGVTYGAYGTGAKPEILGSTKNWADATWNNEGNNVWSVTFNTGNGYSSSISSSNAPGNIYFVEKGQSDIICGVGIKNGTYLTDKTQLTKAGEFAAKHGTAFRSDKKVYIYCEANPSTVYDRIEIAESRDVVSLNSNVTVDNIAVKFGGAHGLNGSNLTNVKITNCEIGYIGGKLNGTEDEDGTAPMGNGIQFGQGGSNLEASYNYIYQCYDAGVTFQKWSKSETFNDVRFTNNLLTNNFYNMEIWSDDNGQMSNILIEGNVMKDAGYCWSWDQRFDTGNIKIYAANIYGGKNSYNTNSANSLIVRNNVFDNTRANQVCWYWDNTHPATYEYLTVSGNSFYQKKGSYDDYSMQYGNSGLQYASSQDSLEYAVSKFDANPQIVCWVETD